jgi:hypothetical protein
MIRQVSLKLLMGGYTMEALPWIVECPQIMIIVYSTSTLTHFGSCMGAYDGGLG